MDVKSNRARQRVPDRRAVLGGLSALGGAGTLSTVLANSALAKTVAETLEPVTLTTQAGRQVSASLAVPQSQALPAPAIVLFHEWWGLNDNIKTMAAELASHGYLALAVDLYKGAVATTPRQAERLMRELSDEEANDTAASWMKWLKEDKRSNGKMATIGWCFGGGWSLNASLLKPVEATVIYYGRVDKTADQLAALKGPVLGHFGTLDTFINEHMVSGFAAAMGIAEKDFTVHWYTANHAFANPTSARYDAPDAKLAWSRTLEFLQDEIGGA